MAAGSSSARMTSALTTVKAMPAAIEYEVDAPALARWPCGARLQRQVPSDPMTEQR